MTASKRTTHPARKPPAAAGARPAGRPPARKPVGRALSVRPAAGKPLAKAAARPAAKHAQRQPAAAHEGLAALIADALDGLKALNIAVFDVRGLSDVTDTIVSASGTSDRHVKSLAGRVLERAREAGVRALGLVGERDGEWVLVDLQDVVVHVMLPRVREFYALEKLWDVRAADRGVPA
jgi:ribosome-associated protein